MHYACLPVYIIDFLIPKTSLRLTIFNIICYATYVFLFKTYYIIFQPYLSFFFLGKFRLLSFDYVFTRTCGTLLAKCVTAVIFIGLLVYHYFNLSRHFFKDSTTYIQHRALLLLSVDGQGR